MEATAFTEPVNAVVARVRAALLQDDYAAEDDLAAALRVSTRTVQRLELPYVKIGLHRYYSVAGARERLLQPPAA